MSLNQLKSSTFKRCKSEADMNSDTDSSDEHPKLQEKLSDDRRKSRPSAESSPSTSLSPNSPNLSPSPHNVLSIFQQNKSRDEKPQNQCHLFDTYDYTLPALDLALHTFKPLHKSRKSLDENIIIRLNNTLDLSDEIIDDVYDSFTSWDETEIESNDKHTMKINQFIIFFNKYIYSTLCIDDENDIKKLEMKKPFIAEAMFDNICFQNSDEIQFAQLVNSIDKLSKNQFIKALNVYDARNIHRELSDPASPLVSICENTPLAMGDDDADLHLNQFSYSCIIHNHDAQEARDDDEKLMFIPKVQKRKSMKEMQALLMKEPENIFEKYDMMKNGKLTVSQFKCLLLELYPTFNDDDFARVFLEMQHSNTQGDGLMGFEYKQKVSIFGERISNLKEFPDKNEFLEILIETFGDNSYACILTECKTYDDLNRNIDNHIELVTNIRQEFEKNKLKKRGHEIEITKIYVEDLWRWINEYGIPAIRQHETLDYRHVNKDIIEKYNNLCDEYNKMKSKIKIYEDAQNKNDGKDIKILNELNELKSGLDKFQMENMKWRQVMNGVNNKQMKGIELLNENSIEIKKMIPMIESDIDIERMKVKLLEKDVRINKLECEMRKHEENTSVVQYIKNNMVSKRRNNINVLLLFFNGIAFGYIIGMRVKKRRKLILYSGAGIGIALLLGFNQGNKYWRRCLYVSTGFLIGFAVAFRR